MPNRKIQKPTEAEPVPDPPAGLSTNAQDLWRKLVPIRVSGLSRLTLLEQGLRALDRADQAARIIDAEGLVAKDQRGKMPHSHPLLRVEEVSRKQFLKTWDLLGLTHNVSRITRWGE